MNYRLWAFSALVAVCVTGCQTTDSATNASNTTDSNSVSKPVESNSENPKDSTTKVVSSADLPAELKNDAYEYYGLERTDPLKFKFKRDKMSDQEGTQKVSLSKVEKDFAEFKVEYDGVLAQSGPMTLRLDKGGIRVIASESIKQDPESYELPTDLKVGKTWITKTTQESTIQLVANNKVEGTGTVKTPVATYNDALIVTATGTGKANGNPIKMTTKIWLVKGRGAVRTEIINVSGGKTEKTTLEESK
jgi:hypothetical protein